MLVIQDFDIKLIIFQGGMLYERMCGQVSENKSVTVYDDWWCSYWYWNGCWNEKI